MYSDESVLFTVAIFQFQNGYLAYMHLSTYFVFPTRTTTLEPEQRLSLRPRSVADVELRVIRAATKDVGFHIARNLGVAGLACKTGAELQDESVRSPEL